MGQFFTWLFFIICSINIAFCDKSSDESMVGGQYKSRIAGGHVANIEDHAYRVHLFPIHCGGTIIGNKWILSASICYHLNMTVLVGHDDIDGIESGNMKVRQSYMQKTEIWHEDKHAPIMLIELYENLKLDKSIMMASLYHLDEITDGLLGTVAGFGATDVHTSKSSVLRAVEVPIVTHTKCVTKFPDYAKVLSTNPDADFCAGFDLSNADNIGGHHSHCKGDYGSGLMVKGELVGVAIHSFECGRAKTPAVFASVPFERNWIIRTMAMNMYSEDLEKDKDDEADTYDDKMEEFFKIRLDVSVQ